MYYALALTPVIGALIGWLTNIMAIKLIFRPRKPIIFPLINFEFQGLIPKRKHEIAKQLGVIIERELISLEDLIDRIATTEAKERLIDVVVPKIRHKLLEKLPGLLPGTLKDLVGTIIEEMMRREAPYFMEELSLEIGEEVKQKVSFSEIIESKINGMDWEGLEQLVLEISSRELRHIEILGAVIGFFIGLVQSLLIYMMV